jgi:hypothetical protein
MMYGLDDSIVGSRFGGSGSEKARKDVMRAIVHKFHVTTWGGIDCDNWFGRWSHSFQQQERSSLIEGR